MQAEHCCVVHVSCGAPNLLEPARFLLQTLRYTQIACPLGNIVTHLYLYSYVLVPVQDTRQQAQPCVVGGSPWDSVARAGASGGGGCGGRRGRPIWVWFRGAIARQPGDAAVYYVLSGSNGCPADMRAAIAVRQGVAHWSALCAKTVGRCRVGWVLEDGVRSRNVGDSLCRAGSGQGQGRVVVWLCWLVRGAWRCRG